LFTGIDKEDSPKQGLARATRAAVRTGRQRRIGRLTCQGTTEKFRPITSEPQIGCDPVCSAGFV
jgi:hypothetical protein